jgi:hypothetical protein
VPRILEDTPEKLLGKRGSICDKHNMARGILEERLRGIRISARSRRASWDELAGVASLVVRGVLSYTPLVGLPFPSTLHNEDAAFQRLVLAGLGTRASAERVSLLASRSAGGAQLASTVESCVAAVARDLIILLNGRSQAGTLARDSLREAYATPAAEVDALDGLAPYAMRFLAGYGDYA